MMIASAVFQHRGAIPFRYTCDGEDVRPPLEISGVPQGAQSLALILDDPDAPRGTWVHWIVWNIPPETRFIPEQGLPNGAVEGITSSGAAGYRGPCPPSGAHRYFFKAFALDITLSLAPAAGAGELAKAMEGHILEHAELMGTYRRH